MLTLLPAQDQAASIKGFGKSATEPAACAHNRMGNAGYATQGKVLITVVVPELSALVPSGSGDMHVESFNTPALKLAISGSGDAELSGLTAGEMNVSMAGSVTRR